MTTKQIKDSIESGELKLNIGDKFGHYSIVIYMLFIPLLSIYFFIKDYFFNDPPLKQISIWINIGLILISIFCYLLQRKRLRFQILETSLNSQEAMIIFEEAIQTLGWTIKRKRDKEILAKTHPHWLTGSWGEQVTILFDDKKIYINSICDLDKKASVASFGNNKKNVVSLIDEINKISKSKNILIIIY